MEMLFFICKMMKYSVVSMLAVLRNLAEGLAIDGREAAVTTTVQRLETVRMRIMSGKKEDMITLWMCRGSMCCKVSWERRWLSLCRR